MLNHSLLEYAEDWMVVVPYETLSAWQSKTRIYTEVTPAHSPTFQLPRKQMTSCKFSYDAFTYVFHPHIQRWSYVQHRSVSTLLSFFFFFYRASSYRPRFAVTLHSSICNWCFGKESSTGSDPVYLFFPTAQTCPCLIRFMFTLVQARWWIYPVSCMQMRKMKSIFLSPLLTLRLFKTLRNVLIGQRLYIKFEMCSMQAMQLMRIQTEN